MKKRVTVDTNKLEGNTKYRLFPRIHWNRYFLKPYNRHVYTCNGLKTVLDQNLVLITIRRLPVGSDTNIFTEPRLSMVVIITAISRIRYLTNLDELKRVCFIPAPLYAYVRL